MHSPPTVIKKKIKNKIKIPGHPLGGSIGRLRQQATLQAAEKHDCEVEGVAVSLPVLKSLSNKQSLL